MNRLAFSLTLLLAALWLAVSGVYKPVILALGVASVALVVWLSVRMRVIGVEHNPVLFSWRLPAYWFWLIKRIFWANIQVTRRVFQPQGIKPSIIVVPVTQKTSIGKVTYGNSCTLTPGTVTLRLTREELTAHVLDDESARDLTDGSMAEKICWLEGKTEPKR